MEEKKTTGKKASQRKAKTEAMTLLKAMSAVIRKVKVEDEDENEVFNTDIYKDEAKSIAFISDMLGLTAQQAVILSVLVENSDRSSISPSHLADEMGLSYIESLAMRPDFKALEAKRYVIFDEDGDMSVPESTISAFAENKPCQVPDYSCSTIDDILAHIRSIYKLRDDHDIKEDDYVRRIDRIIDQNPNLPFSKECFRLGFNGDNGEMEFDDRLMFYTLIYRFVYEDDDRVGWHDLRSIVENENRLVRLKRLYNNKVLTSVRKNVIEACGDGNFFDRDYFHLSDEVKDAVLGEIGGSRSSRKGPKMETVLSSRITSKELFYNASEASQVAKLRSLLENDNYCRTLLRLNEKGLRSGFTCLFYGGPGTGKTETVYQLARQTGRDIVPVNVNEIKSCWVGESEKLIKHAFDNYRRLVEESPVTPILLFNEADAIFGVRKEGATDAVDKMENSIQNIILQEMEKLQGILIATTNLTENLDKAFERRFLYKINFRQPEPAVKSRIWRSMMPELTEEQAASLSTGFDFSGGQIENIIRKKEIRFILDGIEPGFDEIRSFCGEERISGSESSRPKIGF